jgi:hypothetical protein
LRCAAICFVFLGFMAHGAIAQGVPTPGGIPQAPIGHRQPTPADLPPDVRKQEEPGAPQSEPQPQSQAQTPARSRSQSRQQSARGLGGGGPPILQVGPSCEAAGRGAVVLGRNKEACLADENAALKTLKENWARYAASDKTLCIGNHRRARKLCRALVLSRGQQGCARDPKRGSAGGRPQYRVEHDDRLGERRQPEA